MLSTVPQIAKQADDAIRHAHTINRAGSLVELWSYALEVVLDCLDPEARRYEGQSLHYEAFSCWFAV
jgi:hypothetical protein